MNPNRFYSVPYDARNNTKILRLGVLQKGKMQAFGRWQALLGMLYDEHGLIDVSDDVTLQMVSNELCFSKSEQTIKFLDDCARAKLIEADLWGSMRHIVSRGVADEIEYKRGKAEAGKQGGKASRKQTDKQQDKQTDKQNDKHDGKQERRQTEKHSDKPLSLSLSNK